jgi:hypothetical protein
MRHSTKVPHPNPSNIASDQTTLDIILEMRSPGAVSLHEVGLWTEVQISAIEGTTRQCNLKRSLNGHLFEPELGLTGVAWKLHSHAARAFAANGIQPPSVFRKPPQMTAIDLATSRSRTSARRGREVAPENWTGW